MVSEPGVYKNIGIMGGTFDPIHLGHLLAAEEARVEYDLEEVIFVPAGCPPHKSKDQVSHGEHRYMMTVIATINNPYFRISPIEMEASSPAYTIHTVQRFRQELGPGHNLFFITGADAILDIDTWKGCDELLDLCNFIALTRPGYPLYHLENRLGLTRSDLREKIQILSIPGIGISSTEIRRRARQGRTIKYMTPAGVEQYILKNRLYREEKTERRPKKRPYIV